MNSELRIAVFAGPSGGHLFPALAFAESFRQRYPNSLIELVTGERGRSMAQKFDSRVFNSVVYVPDFPSASGMSLRSLVFLLKLAQSFLVFSRYLAAFKPNLCVGFGSYVAYPGIVLSSWKKIPTLIHEQNLVPGKATRHLISFTDCVGVSFDETFKEMSLKKRVVTGLPLRKYLREAAAKKTQSPNSKFRILIVGGSQGANRINQVVLETFSALLPEEKKNIAVMHITGQTDYESVAAEYRRLEIENETYPFFENMQQLYAKADWAITRAGANTLFELALFGVPAVAIPYPYAGAHQKANALYFAEKKALLCQDEKDLDEKWLTEQMRTAQKDSPKLNEMRRLLASLVKADASERLVDLSVELLKAKSQGKSK